MRLKEIFNVLDTVAPFAISQDYCRTFNCYDNSGVQLDCGKDIERVLFSLDLSQTAIGKAKEEGARLIVTHHPAIFSPLSSLRQGGEGAQVLACAQAGISVISAHLNLDCAKDGIDESLMCGLGGRKAEAVMHDFSCGGYGRVYRVEERELQEFVLCAERELGAQRVITYGDRPVKKVASFCGAGCDEESIAFARANGADTFVSSDCKHHLLASIAESGMNAVFFTHYAAEQYGFARYFEKFDKKIRKSGVTATMFVDERFL